mmetsp:Transcript_13225/g.35933  ORF Transcript_13225/g.35933 Transcript_13225/m.35933 type:complete len:277 (+) Transcript_13225:69-899(+)|eukprot:CAMPEP_0202357748 /NCGR_PEP_ID=MMETSP1126-20121109/11657_1 /ASSEMBLY_ACC=CAM_ASM_000457 /TAXON_ID=3047 /ORGANISM="Dunaliella tertiolecta, Strain CCMP1320" /LENGTH=276 /DNA_ID=CAMNT_0048950703 /DNA_START=8 /DNA_END=838 /DNA_ORIENTATION=+
MSTSTSTSLLLSLHAPQGTALAQQVVLGFCDGCGGIGSRLLSSLRTLPDARIEDIPLQLQGPVEVKPAFDCPSNGKPSPVVLKNIYEGPSTSPAVSAICLNCVVPEGQQAYLAAALLAFVQQHHHHQQHQQQQQAGESQSQCPSPMLAVVAAMTMPSALRKGAHVLQWNGATLPQQLSALPQIPPTTKVQDSMLAVLLHAINTTGQPAVLIAVPGHKPGVMSRLSDSADTLHELAHVVEGAGLLGRAIFDASVAEGLSPTHNWFNSAPGGGELMYL